MTTLNEKAVALVLDKTISTMMNDVVDKAVGTFSQTDPKYCYMQGMVAALYAATADPLAERLLKRWFENMATDDVVTGVNQVGDQLASALAEAERMRAKTLEDITKLINDA